MTKPLILDLYCCQGGAARGYELAGFEPHGSDLAPQPRYPYAFAQGDALALMRHLLDTGLIRRYAAIHASPPCQRRTKAQKIRGREHPALIAPTRELLIESGLPYVIENVVTEADELDDDPLIEPVLLCGPMFGLRTYRHRLFESNVPIAVPEHPQHVARQIKMGRPIADGDFYQAVGNFSGVDIARRDMGVEWMTRDGVRECIPPAYARHVGESLLAAIGAPAS